MAPYDQCGAKTRAGTPCKYPAGRGTNHVGEGRCKHHGGSSPSKSGRYSKIKREGIKTLIEQYEADPDPLSLLPELAATRALFQDYIERYDEWMVAFLDWHASWGDEDGTPKPRKVMDLADAYKLLSEVSKIVARIEKVKSDNHVTRADLCRIMQEMGRTVDRYVDDNSTKEKIRDDWLSIRL